LHRWFVEFNPLYLLSAALVLGGCFLLSRGLAGEESAWAPIGITLVSEVYAVALAGGAALLTRIGQRRPATMLALLFVLYQWDLTLHTETCALLGGVGPWAAAAWLAIFAGKIRLLAWAVRVRLAPRIVTAWVVGAVGLALGPHVVPGIGGRPAGALVAVWCFALGALYRRGGVESLEELTEWGRTVLARATRAAWLLSAAVVAAHVLFWAKDHAIDLSSVLVVAPLLCARAIRREARMWPVVVGALAFVGLALPGALSVSALLAAVALVLRALSPAFDAEPSPSDGGEAAEPPYRSTVGSAPVTASPAVARAVVDIAERARSYMGAVFALYLAAWTVPWSGGAWPLHVATLDAVLTIAVLVAVWRLRVRAALAPLVAFYAQLVVQAHLVPAPRSAAQWGGVAVALGFALLAASLGASYRLRARVTPGGSGGPLSRDPPPV
jgi:hypothetical protein